MQENLLIVFAKNAVRGKTKTRLAATIGIDAAFGVYQELVSITEAVSTERLNWDLHVYFSDSLNSDHWHGETSFVQQGNDLGERMYDAFQRSISKGYRNVVGIGADLPEITTDHLLEAFGLLSKHDAVFGPAKDGGYYLIGMSRELPFVFQNKPWSTRLLLSITLDELSQKECSYALLEEMNDIDTEDDLRASSIADKFAAILDPNN